MAEIEKIENCTLKKWRKNRNDEKTGDEKTGFYCILSYLIVWALVGTITGQD